MAELKTYSPDQVKVTFGGASIVGFADGVFINIESSGEGVTSVAGADGEVARSINLDPRYTITLTLMQTSSSNQALSMLADVDRISGGNGALPIIIRDLRGHTLFGGTGWIVNKASASFSNTADETREWVLESVGQFISGGTNA